MRTTLMLGSAPNATLARDYPRASFDRIVAINNAWAVRPELNRAHAVVSRVVLDFGQAKRFQHGRYVHPKAPPQALLESIPSADRILWRPAPCLDGSFSRFFLLVGTAKRHPFAMLLEHFANVVDGAQVIMKHRLADRDD